MSKALLEQYTVELIAVTMTRTSYEYGCETKYYDMITLDRVTGNNATIAVLRFMEFIGCRNLDEIETDINGEPGTLEYQYLGTKDLEHATESQIEQWKKGELELFDVVCTGILCYETKFPVSFYKE
jgi:hypothetical protein